MHALSTIVAMNQAADNQARAQAARDRSASATPRESVPLASHGHPIKHTPLTSNPLNSYRLQGHRAPFAIRHGVPALGGGRDYSHYDIAEGSQVILPAPWTKWHWYIGRNPQDRSLWCFVEGSTGAVVVSRHKRQDALYAGIESLMRHGVDNIHEKVQSFTAKYNALPF